MPYNFSYGYNLDGTLASETYPSGRVVQTPRDGGGRVTGVSGQLGSQSTPYVSGLLYAPHGAYSQMKFNNNLYRNWSFNNRLQPTVIKDSIANSDTNILLRLTYTWPDPNNGNANNGAVINVDQDNGGPGFASFLTFHSR